MMGGLKRAASPATFIAVLALIAAVVGTAIAGPNQSNTAKTAKKALKLAQKNQKRINRIQLTPGPQGPQGLPAANGAPGADGSALAYARVATNGSVDAANSKNISSTNISAVGGYYCFHDLSFTPHNVVANSEYFEEGLGEHHYFAQTSLFLAGDAVCSGETQAEAVIIDANTGTPVAKPFFIVFN